MSENEKAAVFPNWQAGFYFAMAVAGAIWTWTFNLQHFAAGGTGGEFFTLPWVNPVTSSLTADLTVGAMTFLVWMVVEARRLGMRLWGVYVVLTFSVAFAFAAPLFLWARERKLFSGGDV